MTGPFLHHSVTGLCDLHTGGWGLAGSRLTHPSIEHLIPKAAVELLWVGFWVETRGGKVSQPAGASQVGLGQTKGAMSDPPEPSMPTLASQGPFSRKMLTSRLMKLQGDMGIKAQTEVVVEDVQGQLEKCQGVEKTEVTHLCQLFPRPILPPTAPAQSKDF